MVLTWGDADPGVLVQPRELLRRLQTIGPWLTVRHPAGWTFQGQSPVGPGFLEGTCRLQLCDRCAALWVGTPSSLPHPTGAAICKDQPSRPFLSSLRILLCSQLVSLCSFCPSSIVSFLTRPKFHGVMDGTFLPAKGQSRAGVPQDTASPSVQPSETFL